MDFIENIKQRNEISRKCFLGIKISAEEKYWCKVNPTFNEKYDFPCYQKDVIKLLESTSYVITVTLEHLDENKIIIPHIGVAEGKGNIVAKREAGNGWEEFSTKILGVMISKDRPSSTFKFIAKNGYLAIEYECQYFDGNTQTYRSEPSVLNFSYGMKKEVIDESTCRFFCKHPLDEKCNFTSMIFTINWKIFTTTD